MDPQRVQSLEIVKEVVRDERSAQLSHFDALDTKAGVILGFAGALIALTPGGHAPIIIASKVAALASAFCGISTFWPRQFWNLDVRTLRDDYLAAEPRFAEMRVLDTMIAIARRNDETLAQRGRRTQVRDDGSWSRGTSGGRGNGVRLIEEADHGARARRPGARP